MAEDLNGFRCVIGAGFVGGEGVLRIPVGQFGLHQHAQPVRGGKGGLRGAVAVKAHAVDAVGAVSAENVPPGVHGHGAIARFREHGAVGFTAQENAAAVQGEAAAERLKVADAEGDRFAVHALRGDGQGIETAVLQVPAADIRIQREIVETQFGTAGSGACLEASLAVPGEGGRRNPHLTLPIPGEIEIDTDADLVPVWVHANAGNEIRVLGPQAQTAQQAVPVGLGLV